ncbi:MAG UNVERIFIED_CONTAM: ATP-binding protein [Planctomycetaceae bacterium]|jgi:hypothetical protein
MALTLCEERRGLVLSCWHTPRIRKHQDPTADSYDRYQPALHETASALLQEWCDEVLFASYRVYTRKEDQGFSKSERLQQGLLSVICVVLKHRQRRQKTV